MPDAGMYGRDKVKALDLAGWHFEGAWVYSFAAQRARVDPVTWIPQSHVTTYDHRVINEEDMISRRSGRRRNRVPSQGERNGRDCCCAVLAGKTYLSSAIALQLLQSEQATKVTAENMLLRDLTLSERRILRLIAEGLSSKEIGDQLSIHCRTVENHRSNMCRKLNIEGANALLRFALQHKEALK